MPESALLLQLKVLLRKAGCTVVGTGATGATQIWRSPITNTEFPVDPRIRTHATAMMVLKRAGLSELESDLIRSQRQTDEIKRIKPRPAARTLHPF